MKGLPRDELFVYEDALRHGHTVVIALADDEALAPAARHTLTEAGAQTIDAARERWWLGLHSGEQERYGAGPDTFERDEAIYRRGFEAALGADARGHGWEESVGGLRDRHGPDVDVPGFRRGWERGQAYQRHLGAATGLKKTA